MSTKASVVGGAARHGEQRPKDLQVYKLWYLIIVRCYKKDDHNYAFYGAKGVTVSERWLTYCNFYDDLKGIDGYDEEKFRDRKLHLDKDIKQKGLSNKVYSLETCMFVDAHVNRMAQEVDQKKLKYSAIGPDGTEYLIFGLKNFCREHKLNHGNVFRSLKIGNGVRGWTFSRY